MADCDIVLSKVSHACLQAPRDQPKVAQAMIERWVDGVLEQEH